MLLCHVFGQQFLYCFVNKFRHQTKRNTDLELTMSPQHTTTSSHQRSRILQQQDAQMSPRMLMRKQLREDPSGYHTEALHIEPKFSTEPEPVPTLQAKNVSKIEFYTLHSEIIQFQVHTPRSISFQ